MPLIGPLIYIVVMLVVVGLILWAIQQFPMDPTIARLIRVVVVVFAVIFLLYYLLGSLPPAYSPYRR